MIRGCYARYCLFITPNGVGLSVKIINSKQRAYCSRHGIPIVCYKGYDEARIYFKGYGLKARLEALERAKYLKSLG